MLEGVALRIAVVAIYGTIYVAWIAFVLGLLRRRDEPWRPTRRARVVAAVLTAIGGVLLGLAWTLTGDFMERSDLANLLPFLMAAAAGGFLAGAWIAPMLGQTGLQGWLEALIAGITLAFVGAFVGGNLFLPIIGSFGAGLVFVMAQEPAPVAVWVVWTAVLHLVLRRLRHPSSPGRA